MTLKQPLLRGFGTDVNRAEIELAGDARKSEVQKLRAKLIDIAAKVEQASWVLVLSVDRLHIQQQLVKRTEEDRRRVTDRENFDASPGQAAQENSYVEHSLADLVHAQEQVQIASDKLKTLMNDPKLPVSGETLVLPTTQPVDKPITFNLLDAVTTALRDRPEVQRALLTIKDAAIRQRVAENGLLPVLDISATVRYNGMDPNAPAASYGNNFKGNFIDYLLSGQFKVPIGNRGPRAQYRQRVLEREKTVRDYQAEAQTVIGDVKDALHTVTGSYRSVGATRSFRRAAADNVRALDIQQKAGAALTPEFLLNLKLNAEQQLATAERNEAQAVVTYDNAITSYYKATGTLLQQDGIEFKPLQ